MANENDIGGKVGLDITDFKANIAALNQQIKVIDSGFKAAAAGMDDWSKSEEGLQERISSLNQITDLQRQKIANLTAQYEKIAAEKGENSKAAQDLQIRINKETEALNKNEAELRKNQTALDNFGKESTQVAKETDKMTKSVEDATKELREIGGNAAKAAATGIAAIGTAAAAAIGGLVKFSGETDKAMNRFQARTGETAEELEAFRGIAQKLYTSNLGESMDDVAASMALVKQVTGETGQALEDSTRNALLLRDTFGFDVRESINAVNSLTQQFGISAEEAFTLIAQGAQMGANKNGDLLDVLNEYAPHFAQLGMNANEFTDTLIQGAISGAFQIDKVGDAVKEFGIRSKDGSKLSAEGFAALGLDADQMFQKFAKGGPDAEQAFQLVIQKLGEMEDPLAQNQAGVALFGTQFEDLGITAIKQLADIDDNADMTRDTLKKINDVQYSDLGSALEGLKRQFVTDISEPVGQRVIPVVQNLIEKVKNVDVQPIVDGFTWLIDNAGNIASGAAAIGTAMITWNVISTITGVVKAIQAWRVANEGLTIAQAALNLVMAANPIGLIITIIAALVVGIIALWNTNEDFRNALIGAWEAIKKAAVAVWDWLVKLFTEDIPAAFRATLDYVKNHWDTVLLLITNPIAGAVKLLYDLSPQFREWVDGIIVFFKELPGKLWAIFQDTQKKIDDWGKKVADWIKTEVPKLIARIGEFFNELPGKIGYALGYALGKLIQWGIDGAKWIAEEVPKLISRIGEFFAELPGKLWGFLVKTQQKIDDWGKGVADWIKTEVPKFIARIGSFFAELPGKLWGFLTETQQKINKWGSGVLDWVKTEIPKIIQSIGDFFAALPGKMLDIGGDIVRGLWDGISGAAGWLMNKVKDFAGGIVGGIKDALGIHSPSRVMRDQVGAMIGAGMAEGISNSARQVNAAMQDINRDIGVTTSTGQRFPSGAVTNHYNFENMMAGTNFVVRTDADIPAIAKEVASALKNVVNNNGRGMGGVSGVTG